MIGTAERDERSGVRRDADADRPRGADGARARPRPHALRRQPRPGRAGRARERDVRDPGPERPPPRRASPAPAPVVVRTAPNWTPDDPRPPTTDTRSPPRSSPGSRPRGGRGRPERERRRPCPCSPSTSADPSGAPDAWLWQRWLLDSGPADDVFTLTPRALRAASAARAARPGSSTTARARRSASATVCSGVRPAPGTVFTVTYLAGGGVVGNVPADTIVQSRPGPAAGRRRRRVTNPFAATGGADEETAQQIRDRAPQAFRAKPLRVVRPSDYVAAAQSLPWVLQAGTTLPLDRQLADGVHNCRSA